MYPFPQSTTLVSAEVVWQSTAPFIFLPVGPFLSVFVTFLNLSRRYLQVSTLPPFLPGEHAPLTTRETPYFLEVKSAAKKSRRSGHFATNSIDSLEIGDKGGLTQLCTSMNARNLGRM